jgi:F-type H+-transporting ATPase subunit epsilon
MATMFVEIVSPEVALWSGEATALIARSSEGEFAIMPQHTLTVGDLVPGLVRVTSAEGTESFIVHGGYFNVGTGADGLTHVSVLASVAEDLKELDVPRAQSAKDRAEAVLAGGDRVDPAAVSVAKAALQRAELRLGFSSK